jgi:hypothetical protein
MRQQRVGRDAPIPHETGPRPFSLLRVTDLFAAEDEADSKEWVEFFSRTREADNRRKGLVEIAL